ncbi:MAG: hypothetical protein ACI9FZ_000639 [Bacteroidia bacterium]|jgi:hypothetical protein
MHEYIQTRFKDATATGKAEQFISDATERHNRISVRPHLSPQHHADYTNEGTTIVYKVSNQGLGPAVIKSVQLFLDKEPFEIGEDPIESITTAVFGETPGFAVKSQAWMKAGYALPEKTDYEYGTLWFQGMDKSHYPSIEVGFNRMDIRIEYESFYEERFVFDSRDEPNVEA